jgi:hypothetical protein
MIELPIKYSLGEVRVCIKHFKVVSLDENLIKIATSKQLTVRLYPQLPISRIDSTNHLSTDLCIDVTNDEQKEYEPVILAWVNIQMHGANMLTANDFWMVLSKCIDTLSDEVKSRNLVDGLGNPIIIKPFSYSSILLEPFIKTINETS